MLAAFHVVLSTALVMKPALVLPGGSRAVRMSSSALPDMYRDRWARTKEDGAPSTKANNFDAAKYVGALLGASAMAAIGVGISTASTDYSLSLLGASGEFNEPSLFTVLFRTRIPTMSNHLPQYS